MSSLMLQVSRYDKTDTALVSFTLMESTSPIAGYSSAVWMLTPVELRRLAREAHVVADQIDPAGSVKP